MTSSINSLGQSPVAPEVAGQNGMSATSRTGAAADSAESTNPGEAVTLSADAQTTTQLLGASRSSSGIDQQAVAQLRTSIQNGTYNVSPDMLARSIASAVKEATP